MGKIAQSVVIWGVGLLSWQDIVTWTEISSSSSSSNISNSRSNSLGGVLGFAVTSPIISNHHHRRRQFPIEGSSSSSSSRRLEMVKEWLGGMMSGGGGGNCVAVKENELKRSLEEWMGQPENDWSSIRQQWEAHEDLSEELRRLRPYSLKDGTGRASPMHKLRLFDDNNNDKETNKEVRVTLFRDAASWCPYCQKVWTTLEEKRIPYRIEYVNMRCYGDKTPEFLRVQPNGNIPVAIIDGTTYRQSNDILQVLEQTFQGPPHPSLAPSSKPMEDRANTLFRLERQLFGAWMNWLTSRDGAGGGLKRNFVSVLQQVEQQLQYANDNLGGSFFLGEHVSMVDMMFIPFVERIFASLLYFKAFPIRIHGSTTNDYPNVNQWMDAMETLPSYQLTKSDYYTHCWDLPPQLGGCVTEDDSYQAAINGLQPGSWHLPLTPHNVDGIEPEWHWAAQEASLEAAERLTYNHKNIVLFAARGADNNNNPFNSYMAPLADPKATSNPNVVDSIDAILRLISLQLIHNTSNDNDVRMTKIAHSLVQYGGMDHVKGVISSLAYLRDRIGVPRDMKLPAARQLRAHLNWSIQHLETAMEEK